MTSNWECQWREGDFLFRQAFNQHFVLDYYAIKNYYEACHLTIGSCSLRVTRFKGKPTNAIA